MGRLLSLVTEAEWRSLQQDESISKLPRSITHCWKRRGRQNPRREATVLQREYNSRMSDVTRILSQIESGDPAAAEQLLPLVYDELRKLAAARLANEKPGQTLQATALVHDAYLRLVDVKQAQQWNSRGHFFAAAAEAMRRILVEQARRKRRVKHGGDRRRVDLEEALSVAEPGDNLLSLDEALSRLAAFDPLAAKLVELRYFTGLTMAQAAETLGVSLRNAERNWTYAKSWLHRELADSEANDSHPNPG